MTLDVVIEDLVALRLDRTVRNADPLHGFVVAAEAVIDMEAPRFREVINILEGRCCINPEPQAC
ncbi:hypothetical protein D8B24_15340 [Verminephrobacter aporrectodeae subsp. tuberculatae]|uniref:hypothetical protein n=1 Tax=Verminephrobacter aporrectodeae TaxID=1110389 RepID=UPI00224337CF|nr:hypothetical protein [Verminephrobacter aporrectodeae]MCW8208384.1 hypothetical protein [Verminephrobacter aporrectodeae subsp. tuberculatae]